MNILSSFLSKTKQVVQTISKPKKLWAVLAVASFIALTGQIATVSANTLPEFNVFTGEQDFLKAGWQGASQSIDFTDPLSIPNAQANDLVKFRVYFHNASEGTVAFNTKVRVELSTAYATSHKATAYLNADGVPTVADTVNIKDLPKNFKLEYVPGTSKLWTLSDPSKPDNFDKQTPLPDGVISATGVNIGNIQGCWEYRGFVTFQTKLVAETKPALSITKDVDKATATKGDLLTYTINYKNIGDGQALNAKMVDTLPAEVTYTSATPTPASSNGNIVWNLGNLNAGATGSITLKATVKSDLAVGTYNAVNSATFSADNAPAVTDLASTSITISPPPPANLVLSKSAQNQTQNVDAMAVRAKPGDVIVYSLKTQNTGQGNAENYITSDNIADILEYATLTDNGGGTLSNGTISYPVANINAGQTLTKNFKVTVKGYNDWPANGDIMMSNVYGNVINVALEPPSVSITQFKSAFNVTQNRDATTILANAGDVIKYTLKTGNTGNTSTAYTVSDDISDILEYANVTNTNGAEVVAGVIKWSQTTINAGQTITNTFDVKVKSPLPTGGDFLMVNIYGNAVSVGIAQPTPLPPSLNIQKLVRNVSRNEQNFTLSNSAIPGETLEYKVWFKNVGQGLATGVVLQDVLPANVKYLTGTAKLYLRGQVMTADGIVQNGIAIGDLNPGEEGYVLLQVKTDTGLANGAQLVNKGYIWSDLLKPISAQALTTIAISGVPPSQPVLPPTGAGAGIFGSFSAFMVSVAGYLKRKQKDALAEVLLTKEF